MPGASAATQRVKVLNANWTPGSADDEDGQFQVLIVTDDDERHVLPSSPTSVAALVAMATADALLLWDPEGPTLIAANIVGRMPWTDHFEQQADLTTPASTRDP
jgi:hypothetical protein